MRFWSVPFLILLFVSLSAFCQSSANLNFKITGTLTDSVSIQTLPYATISLASDSTPNIYLKRVASASDGSFELQWNKAGKFVVSFESTGMTKSLRRISLTPEQTLVQLGNVFLAVASKTLGEVTVTATKPLVKVDLDKISYDTKSDPDAQSITALEMLRKVPLVTVDGDDKIQLKGSSNYKIYINGKSSGMMTNNPSQILKSMPASSIKSIEVITEPGAKYDAEGIGGIINIVMERSLTGLTGTVRAGANTLGGYSGGLYLSSKMGKFGLTTNLNYNNWNSPNSTWFMEKENLFPQSASYINQYALSESRTKYLHGSIEASYEIDSLNLLSMNVGGFLGGDNGTDFGKTVSYNTLRDTLSAFEQKTINAEKWGNIDFSFDYQRSFKKPEKLLTISYKMYYTPNSRNNTTYLTVLKNYLPYNQHNDYSARGDEHTFQLDYTEPFNKIHVVEIGAKYILRLNKSTNNYQLQNLQTLNWETLPNIQNKDLNKKENILAAYASYALKFDKFSIKAGARFEATSMNVQLSDTSFNLAYPTLVPSLSASYKLSEVSSFRLSYNQRISRPGIWYLNPFRDNSNPYSITQGNPDLKPELSHSLSLNYNLITSKLTVNTDFFASFVNNSIESLTTSLSDTVQYRTYQNIGIGRSFGLSANANWQLNNDTRFNFNGHIAHNYMAANNNTGIKNSGVNYALSLGTQLIIPLKLKLNIYGGYYSPQISLQGNYSDFLYYYSSLSREFFDKKLNISFNARNPFKQYQERKQTLNTSQFKSYDISTYVSQSYSINISYRFGELKEQIKKAERTISNDDVKGGGGQGGGQ